MNPTMTNAREEFEAALHSPITLGEDDVGEDLKVLCAWIAFRGTRFVAEEENKIFLRTDHTPTEYEEFLRKIDREYESGYGTQELFGEIWLTNGEWIQRHEYDGSEYWDHMSRPDIPERCRGPSTTKSSNKE